jgi:hypothetical protein
MSTSFNGKPLKRAIFPARRGSYPALSLLHRFALSPTNSPVMGSSHKIYPTTASRRICDYLDSTRFGNLALLVFPRRRLCYLETGGGDQLPRAPGVVGASINYNASDSGLLMSTLHAKRGDSSLPSHPPRGPNPEIWLNLARPTRA